MAKKIDMKIGRNEPCSCGSGRKYKKCCLDKQVSAVPFVSIDVKHQFEKMQAIQEQIKK